MNVSLHYYHPLDGWIIKYPAKCFISWWVMNPWKIVGRSKIGLNACFLHMYIYLWLSRPNTESFLANFFDFLSATRPDTSRVFLDFLSDCCCCEICAPLTHFEAGPSVRQTPPGTIRHVSAEGVLSAENKPLRCRLMYMYEFTFRKSQFVETPVSIVPLINRRCLWDANSRFTC